MGALVKFLSLIAVLASGTYIIHQTMTRLETSGESVEGENPPHPDAVAARIPGETVNDPRAEFSVRKPPVDAENGSTLPEQSEPSVSSAQTRTVAADWTADTGIDFRNDASTTSPIRQVANQDFFTDDAPRTDRTTQTVAPLFPDLPAADEPKLDPFGEDPPATRRPAAVARPDAVRDLRDDPFGLDDPAPRRSPSTAIGQGTVPLDVLSTLKRSPPAEADPFAVDERPATTNADPFGSDPLPAAKSSAPARSDDPFDAFPPVDDQPAKTDPFAADPAPARNRPATTAPATSNDPLDAFPPVDAKPAQPKLTDDPFPGDSQPQPLRPQTNPRDAFPSLEPAPADKRPSESPKSTDDPFPGEFPDLETPKSERPARELPMTLDEFPALDTPTSKPESETDVPLFEEKPKPATLDELPPLEERPGFPSFPGAPKPAQIPTPEPVKANDPFPAFEEPGEPLTNKQPINAPTPAKTPPPEINVVVDPSQPTVDDLKGDGVVTPQTPRGRLLPQLEIEKQAPQKALLNKPFVYSIVVRNTGKVPANEVTVQDQIPKGSNLTGTIPQAELIGRRLVWRLGRLEPGAQETISVRVVPIEAGSVGSVATVNFVAEVGAETLITDSAVTMTVDAPETAQVGEMIEYRFRIRNDSRETLRGLVLRDLIPEGLHHPDGEDLENPIGELKPGETLEEALTLKAVKPGTLVNRAILTADGGFQLETVAAVNVGSAKLSVTRSGPKQRFVGRAAIYQNVVTNTTDRPIEDAVVVEQIPAGMEFASASDGGQYHAEERSIFWNISLLEPGQSVILQSKLTPTKAGDQASIVRVVERQGNEIQTVSHTSVDTYAAVGVELTDFDRPFAVGEKVILRIEALNRGTEPAGDVALRAKIPPTMQLMKVRGRTRFRIEGREVVFEPLQSLEAGANEVIELELQAAAPSRAEVSVDIQSQRMPRPLTRETAVQIVEPVRR